MMSEAKFKVGDRVRVVGLPSSDWSMRIGQEFVVSLLDYRGAHMTVTYGTHFIPLDCIELAEPATEAKAPEPVRMPIAQRIAARRAEKTKPAVKVDPYEQHRNALKVKFHVTSESDASLEANIARRSAHDDAVTGRRARLIAALAQELRRPAPVRFPHPGRNFELKD
jgi:hypothetical protein